MTDAEATAVLAVKQVFEQRSMYDAVVAGNYMHHAELIAALRTWAKEFGRPLRIVDVGCGDASLAVKSFAATQVEHYVGVDIAESSIEQARVTTAAWQGRVELICGNLFDALHGLAAGSANVVLASYSLHHFSTADKIKLLREIGRVLEPGGVLLWIDAVRDDGQSREAYIDRLVDEIAHDWTLLSAEERRRAVEHVRSSDYPETEAWMSEQTTAAGFFVGNTLLHGEMFQGWALKKR